MQPNFNLFKFFLKRSSSFWTILFATLFGSISIGTGHSKKKKRERDREGVPKCGHIIKMIYILIFIRFPLFLSFHDIQFHDVILVYLNLNRSKPCDSVIFRLVLSTIESKPIYQSCHNNIWK